MASPFRYFRKHTKAFMAVAAVMCMFLFVFASGTGGGGGNPSQDATATVATWNGETLDQRELASLVRQRVIVDEFLRRLFTQGGGRTGYDLPGNVPNLLLPSQRIDQVETDVIATEVMADLAAEAGITVSDDMINHYVEEFALNNVSRDEILGILRSVGQGDMRENEAIVFSMLRKMLAGYFYRSTYEDASAVVLPEQRWRDWRRINERISLTAAELPVESFEKDVPEPTEAQLQAFYNEYKDFDPNLYMSVDGAGGSLPAPTPGFAEPRRVRLEFLLGSVGEQTEQYLDKITEEEIADYYERNKRREFVKADFESEDAEQPAPGAEEEPVAETPASEDAATEGVDESTPATPPAGEAAPAESEQPAAEQPAESGEAPAPSQPAAPADSTPAEPNDASDPARAPSDGASSAVRRPSPFRLTALQAAPAAESTPTDETASSATEPAPGVEEASDVDEAAPASDEAEANENKAAAAPADSQPAASGAADAATDSDAAADEKEAANDALDEVLEYEPLDKVRDEIRRTLARDKAVAELQQVMNDAAAELQSEYNRYGLAAAMAQEEERPAPKPPERLVDLQWLADKYKLTYEKTALLTDRELFDTAVGKAADAQSGSASVTRAAFVTLKPYEPFLAKELEGDFYLVLKAEDQARRVPEFKEIRDGVAAAWKRREAAVLAENKAKQLAEEAAKSEKPFDALMKEKDVKVIDQTELFSWLDYPMGPGQGQAPSLSKAPPLENIGPAFMDAAFGLKDDDVKGLLNFDRSKAYVIRLHTRQYPEDELKKLFLAEDSGFWPGRGEMRYQRYLSVKDAVDRKILEDRAKFKFDEEWLKRRQERDQDAG